MTVYYFFRIFAFGMYRIRRLFVWLRRSRYSRGFGVQSPFAYGFVRYVVNEHYPYYAYERLMRQMPDIGKKAHKLGRLYFRIVNWKQPEVALSFGGEQDSFRAYALAGRRAVRVVSVDSSALMTEVEKELLALAGVVSFIRVVPEGDYKEFCERILAGAHEMSVLVVEQIHRNASMFRYWKELCAHERVTVAFDLYYCGVILFEKKHYKQYYKINF